MTKLKYKRVLLKLPGELFLGKKKSGIDPESTKWFANEITQARGIGSQIAVVVGGGNIFRGTSAAENGLERTVGDYIGMIATIMNALALQAVLESGGQTTRVLSAIEIKDVCEPYIRRRAIRHLERGRIVIFAGGTGNPYFSTDTAAALRALEIGCQVILKATKGVLEDDHNQYKNGKENTRFTFKEALANKKIELMENSALSLCMDNGIPIIVFNFDREGVFTKAISGAKIGTMIS